MTPYERALAGARFLDREVRGWRRRIRCRELNMATGTHHYGVCGCVLAQLSPDAQYETEAKLLGLDPHGDDAIRYGFFAGADDDAEYDALTVAWRTILRENVA